LSPCETFPKKNQLEREGKGRLGFLDYWWLLNPLGWEATRRSRKEEMEKDPRTGVAPDPPFGAGAVPTFEGQG